jgi:hypothetical protein
MENSVCDAPARTLFACPVSGIEALLLDDASEVASVERLIGVHGTLAVAAVVAPVTTPEPEIETILPGPGTASPLIVLEEFVILPFDRTVPLFVGPLAAMPAETACDASEPGTVNGSEPAARHAGANAATRTLESARIRRGFLILIVIICFPGGPIQWRDATCSIPPILFLSSRAL